MQITCIRCGCDRFKAGEIQPAPEGGYDVVLPCAGCGTPLTAFHEEDAALAADLIQFFAAGPSDAS